MTEATTLRSVVLLEGNADLAAEVVRNVEAAGFDPPVALGDGAFSAQADGHPRIGRVENVRLVGDKVVGDLTNLPRKVAERLQAGAGRVCTSLYENFDRGKRHLGSVLKQIVLMGLGLDVQTLGDLQQLFARTGKTVAFDDGSGSVREFTVRFQAGAEEPESGGIDSPPLSALQDDLDAAIVDGNLPGALAMARKLVALLEGLHGASASVRRPPAPANPPTMPYIQSLARMVRNFSATDADGGLIQPDVALMLGYELEDGIGTLAAHTRRRTTHSTEVRKMGTITDPVLKDLQNQLLKATHDEDHDAVQTILGKIAARKAVLGRTQTLARTDDGGVRVDVEVARRVREYMDKHLAVTDRSVALQRVLDADPDLKRAYANDGRSIDSLIHADAPGVGRCAQDTLALEAAKFRAQGLDPIAAAEKAYREAGPELRREYDALRVRG